MPRGSHVPRNDYPPIRMVQMTGEVYAEIVETAECGGVNLRMYGVYFAMQVWVCCEVMRYACGACAGFRPAQRLLAGVQAQQPLDCERLPVARDKVQHGVGFACFIIHGRFRFSTLGTARCPARSVAD